MQRNNGLNLLIVLCLTALNIGCNRKLVPPKLVSIDSRLQSYVNDFVSEGHAVGKNIVIDNLSLHFTSSLSGQTLGQCSDYGQGEFGTPTILIDAQDWQWESDDYKKIVLFHELGHCVLWRKHVETFNGPNGQITSIMYPYVLFDTNEYTDHWAYYMHELFYGF